MKKLLFYLMIGTSFLPLIVYSFTSLQDAREYAKLVEEYPEIDNDNWLNPLFTSFEKSLVPNIFSRTLSRFGLKNPLWSPSDLKNLLVQVTKQRELDGNVGRFVQVKEAKADESYFIWGDLHGAFHSFVRDLDYLKSEGVIDNSFKIKSDADYFIFNGNAIDQSPFSMETITLILNLMAANPQRIYYLRGSHEDKQAWHGQNLGFSLHMRAFWVSSEQIPLDTFVTNFFNTLPLALYLRGIGTPEKISFVRISPSNRQNNEIDEKKIGGYLATHLSGKNNIHLAEQESKVSEKPISIVTIIKDEDRTDKFTQTTGLALHDPEDDATSWSVLSASSGTYRRTFDFFFDAFAVLRTTKNIADWTISLYNRDVRGNSGFNLSKVYNSTSGTLLKELKSAPVDLLNVTKDLRMAENVVQKLESSIADMQKEITTIKENGFSLAKKIVIEPKQGSAPSVPDTTFTGTKVSITPKMLTFGSTLDLSKGERYSGKQLKASVLSVLKEAAGNGIGSIVPQVLFVDDEYTPEKARENILRFIEQGIDKTIVSMGTPTLDKYLDLVKEKKIAVFFPSTGATIFRKADLTYFIHFRKSYADEAKLAISYALDTLGAKKIVILYQNDAFGLGALEGPIQFAKERNIDFQKEWILIPYERADLNVGEQIARVKEVDPDAILFISVVSIAKEFMQNLGVSYLAQKKLLALSDFGEKEFSDYAKAKGLHFITMNAFPNPEQSTLMIAKEFREMVRKEKIDLDSYAFEGYLAMELMLDCLKKIKGDITSESIIKQFESYKNYNFKGLELNFNPETRELSKYIWLNEGSPEWIRYAIEKPEKNEINSGEIAQEKSV